MFHTFQTKTQVIRNYRWKTFLVCWKVGQILLYVWVVHIDCLAAATRLCHKNGIFKLLGACMSINEVDNRHTFSTALDHQRRMWSVGSMCVCTCTICTCTDDGDLDEDTVSALSHYLAAIERAKLSDDDDDDLRSDAVDEWCECNILLYNFC